MYAFAHIRYRDYKGKIKSVWIHFKPTVTKPPGEFYSGLCFIEDPKLTYLGEAILSKNLAAISEEEAILLGLKS